jgi:DNA-binding transcriptional ArsR family regulator
MPIINAYPLPRAFSGSHRHQAFRPVFWFVTSSPKPHNFQPLYVLTSICQMRYISRVESAFEIIAEPNRRAILSLLVSSEHSVGEIERQLRMSQPAVSKHLRVLRDAGFVDVTIDAQRRLYRLKPEPFQAVNAWLTKFRRFWIAHVDALERHLDRMDRDRIGNDRMDNDPMDDGRMNQQHNRSSAAAKKKKTKQKATRPKPRA